MEENNMKIMFADDIATSSFDPTGGLLKSIIEQQRNKEKARWMVLVIVAGVLSVFLIGNLALYAYAHKSLPKKKKPVSAKKMKM